ncbi:MAG: glutamate--tRNA ligase [Candidatus Omnitrophota bacterium]|nr:glutamate--tRNA ligase [Candidatus Omnitrophota bacterium]
MVKVRFAPSPTGYLHIGGARTCLFNWLYARHAKGTFVLRIEDTDLARSKKEYLEEILESIAWLGMDWDEIYYQSQRFDIYREYAQKLIESGHAYQKEGAIFFKYSFTKVEINDIIRGPIVFTELPKEEEVIFKSDGSPTYNFSCVIDDALMGITHIIRGEDHISNTPKQILIYQALGLAVPGFAHVPLILSPDGGRLSKRFGATSIREYKEEGYLASALANYLTLLSWSPGNNREIISLPEAREVFDITDVNKTGAEFSLDKLNWVNAEYIKRKEPNDFVTLAAAYLKEKNFLPADVTDAYIAKTLILFKERTTKLSDLLDRARFCFYDDYSYAEDTKEVLDRKLVSQFETLQKRMAALNDFTALAIEAEFRETATAVGLKTKDLVHPVRVALTGRKVGPGLFETMEALGQPEVAARLGRLITYWQKT